MFENDPENKIPPVITRPDNRKLLALAVISLIVDIAVPALSGLNPPPIKLTPFPFRLTLEYVTLLGTT
jgi:hypothetical protein